MEEAKTTQEIMDKGDEIINSLEDFNIIDKYKVVRNLYLSFLDCCKASGMTIEEIEFIK